MKNNSEIKLNDGTIYHLNCETTFTNLLSLDKLQMQPLYVWKNIMQEKLGIVLLDLLKDLSKTVILLFGNTTNLKKFNYNSYKFWIDKETRNSLFNLLNSLDEKSDFDLIVGDEIVKLPVSKVKKFLTALEQYASACKVQTLKHVNNIKDIKNVEDLLKYDYTLGYPNLINLNDFI